MKKIKSGIVATIVAASIIVPATAAFAYSTVKFHDGPQPANSIASSTSWRNTVGAEMNINLTAPRGMVFGKSHIDTITTSGVQYISEGIGVGADMSHALRANAWNRCWWIYINNQSGQGSVGSQCWSRVP